MDVTPATTSSPPGVDHVSAQCPSCKLHGLVPKFLKFNEEDKLWKEVEEPGEDVVQIDACPVCNGAWFDAGELDLLAGGEEAAVEDSLEQESKDSDRQCPRGHGSMREHMLPGKIRTPLERCGTCGGLWLDGEERRKLAISTTKEGQVTTGEKVARRTAIYAAQLLTQLPVEVENPERKTPWLVYGMVAFLLGMFLLQYVQVIDTSDCLLQARRARGGQEQGVCLAPVAGALKKEWSEMGGQSITQGEWYTVFTHMFLHGNWAHLLGNLYFLYIFGDNVEELFGRRRFFLLFFLAGFTGGLAEVLLTQSTADPIVGASGGIAGVMAAYLWCFPRNKLFQMILFIQVKLPAWVYLFFWIGFQVVMGFFSKGAGHVAWYSHIFGFLTGIVMTPIVLELRKREVARDVEVPATGYTKYATANAAAS